MSHLKNFLITPNYAPATYTRNTAKDFKNFLLRKSMILIDVTKCNNQLSPG